jgi:hypothetical protein
MRNRPQVVENVVVLFRRTLELGKGAPIAVLFGVGKTRAIPIAIPIVIHIQIMEITILPAQEVPT